MLRIGLIFIALAGAPQAGAVPCTVRVAQALAEPQTLAELAHSVGMGPAQVRFLLDDPELAPRVEALVAARVLLSQRGGDIISELYWRTQGTTKYSTHAVFWLRWNEWLTQWRFLTPFHKRRTKMFSDALRATGEEFPAPLYEKFASASARVEEPGYLRGIRALERGLIQRLEKEAVDLYPSLESELTAYLKAYPRRVRTWLEWLNSIPLPPASPNILARVLAWEIRDILSMFDFFPADAKELERALDLRLAERSKTYPLISAQVKAFLLAVHYDASPATYEEFQEWILRRFEKILTTERQRLLQEWNQRRPQPRKMPASAPMQEAEEKAPARPESEPQPAWTPLPKPAPRVAPAKAPKRHRRSKSGEVAAAPPKAEAPPAPAQPAYELRFTEKAEEDIEILSRSPRLEGQIRRALEQLAQDPMYGSLRTHKRPPQHWLAGNVPVWRSCINLGAGGYRLHWVYEDDKKAIKILEAVHHDY